MNVMADSDSDSAIGLVTRVDDDFISVWTKKHPLQELRFPVTKGPNQPLPGTFVSYTRTEAPDAEQRGGNFVKIDHPLRKKIHLEPNQTPDQFTFYTFIGFPPPESTHFVRQMAKAEYYEISFYAHSTEFGTVVSFREFPHMTWEKKYKALVERFPRELDWVVKQVGTMWRVLSMEEIDDPRTIARISANMPWNSSTAAEAEGGGRHSVAAASGRRVTFSTTTMSEVPEANLLDIGGGGPSASNKSNPSRNDFGGGLLAVQTENVGSSYLTNTPTTPSRNDFGDLEELSAAFNDFATFRARTGQFAASISPSTVAAASPPPPIPSFSSQPPPVNLPGPPAAPLQSAGRGTSAAGDGGIMSSFMGPRQFSNYVVSVLAGLKAKKKLKEAMELEHRIFGMCIDTQIALIRQRRQPPNI